jgi:hypothetical protein
LSGSSGFSANDRLIWTADTGNSGNGPVTVNFTSKSVAGAGAFIQADGPAQFTASIQPFNGGSSLGGPFTVMSDVGGDATFIGVLDNTGANITKVIFSITSCEGDCSDFAIDTVSLNVPAGGTPTATPTATPTGGTPTPTATATATATATLTATPTATASPVSGTLKITPTSKSFGTVKVGHAKKQTFTLTNTAIGGPPITFGNPPASVPMTNPQAFGFPRSGGTNCPQQLLPKKHCKLTAEFVPASPGAKSATMTIFDSGGNLTVPLSGAGQ